MSSHREQRRHFQLTGSNFWTVSSMMSAFEVSRIALSAFDCCWWWLVTSSRWRRSRIDDIWPSPTCFRTAVSPIFPPATCTSNGLWDLFSWLNSICWSASEHTQSQTPEMRSTWARAITFKVSVGTQLPVDVVEVVQPIGLVQRLLLFRRSLRS